MEKPKITPAEIEKIKKEKVDKVLNQNLIKK